MSNTVDFDTEAKKLFDRLAKSQSIPGLDRAHLGQYHDLDCVYTHPKSGGKVYIGNHTAAEKLSILKEEKIYHIVNCQDVTTRNFHENNPQFTYFRFPVSHWWRSGLKTSADVVNYWRPYYEFVGQAVQEGKNVLVHCLAGAHRAGTAGVGWLMFAHGLDYQGALSIAKAKRPAVNPFAQLEKLLFLLEESLRAHDLKLVVPE